MITILLCVSALPAQLELVTHESEVLGKEKQLYVYVPEERAEDERFPVLFVMHGKWGSHLDWIEKGNAGEAARLYRMILVFPDGDQFSWYLDSPTMEDSQYESYIAKELVDYIDANYPTIDDRNARGIMGLSMGGHGALMLAVKYPDTFGSASSLSGILKLTSHSFREDVAERLGPWISNRERWEQNSVWDLAERFQETNTRLLFDSGVDDTKTGAIWDGRLLHEKLVKLQVPHIWRVLPGTHSWEYWTEHLPDHLNFHQAAVLQSQPEQEKWFQYYHNRMDEFLQENAQLDIQPPATPSVALVGSSTFERFPDESLTGYTVYNRGIVADHLGIYERGLTKRMETSFFDMQPDHIFMNMGVNDIGDRHRGESGEPTEERMVEEYRAILTEVTERLPKAKVYICNCSAVRDRYEHLNESIVSWNQRLAELAEEFELPIVDIHSQVVGEDGNLKEELTNDGLHLNPEGYKIWTELMLEALQEQSWNSAIRATKSE